MERHRFYAEEYEKIREKGKGKHRLSKLIAFALVCLGPVSIGELFFKYYHSNSIPFTAFEDIVLSNLFFGIVLGLVLAEIEWFFWEDRYQDYLREIKTD